jgi:hypothetical protein
VSHNPIKIVAAICVYNDYEFLSETIDSISPYVNSVHIIEGAWQTAIDSGANKRSDKKTLDLIRSKLNDKVKYHPVNKATETAQRQEAADICKGLGDFLICPDADEVFSPDSIKNVIKNINEVYYKEEHFGVRLCSYNFFENFSTYYDGCYPRGYRLTSDLSCFETNHFYWPNHNRGISNYQTLDCEECKFYHFSYMRKNTNLFHVKMKFLEKEFGNNLYSQGYNEKDGKYTIPIDKSLFKTFDKEYPENIQSIINQWNPNT